VPSTPFLGRERELAEVGALLASPATRLLTVTGPGGTGKSRLSLQSAALAEALALLRELEDEPAISHMFFRLAVEARRAADPEQARALCRESLSLHHSVTGEAQTLWLLGDVAFQEGRLGKPSTCSSGARVRRARWVSSGGSFRRS
jgi:hypothetical protein